MGLSFFKIWFLMATPTSYGTSQVRNWIWVTAAAASDPLTHCVRLGMKTCIPAQQRGSQFHYVGVGAPVIFCLTIYYRVFWLFPVWAIIMLLWAIIYKIRDSFLWQVYVSCGEHWINPDLSIAQQKKPIFLRNLASDISKIHTFCSTHKIEGKNWNYLP